MNKLLISVVTILIGASAFANSQIQPDFICQEQSGFTYEFYTSTFNEIHVYDETGKFLDHIDGIKTIYHYLETFPAQERYTVKYADGDVEIAMVQFTELESTGHGYMTDNDQTMICVR